MIANEVIFFTVFLLVIVFVLALDLGVFSKRNHVVTFKEAGLWSAVWIGLALGFYLLVDQKGHWIHGIDNMQELIHVQEKYAPHVQIYEIKGADPAFEFAENLQIFQDNMSLEFITGYLVEYALSVDNIFVIILLFTSFGVKENYYKKVLFWGIMGAIVMRFAFIFLGSALLQKFDWILYVFGGFLIITGIRMFVSRDQEETIDPEAHPVVKFVAKTGRVFPRFVKDYFFVRRKGGKLLMTPLFVVLLIIEFTDLIFAVDSVPAVFAVTKDPYLVFFSNIFAILGLRSMFFFLANIMHLFHYLKTGLSVLLVFIGVKMLAHHWLKSVGFETQYSLYIILGILGTSVAASLLFPQKKEEAHVA